MKTRPSEKILLFVSVVLFALIASPLNIEVSAEAMRISEPVQNGPVSAGNEVRPYAPRRLLVKLKADALRRTQARDASRDASQIGIESLDAIGRQLKVKRMRRAYRALKNEALARKHKIDRWFLVELAQDENIPDVVSRYAANPNVAAATPDWRLFTTVEPNDPLHENHWGHDNNGQLPDYCWYCGGHDTGSPVGNVGFDANAEDAWAQSQGYGDPLVVIAILDTGVDLGHPDLRLVPGWDFGSGDANPDDDSADSGHGTACAGIAAAVANNGIGAAGIAGGVSIMPLKIADDSGAIYTSAVQLALYYAVDNGVDIVSMSFGAALTDDPATDRAIQYATDSGVTLFAATGNANAASILYPANNSNVIAVGAASPCGGRKRSSSNPNDLNPGVYPDPNSYTCDGERWWGSSYGATVPDTHAAVDIIAPTILPTTDIRGIGGYNSAGDYYKWFNGTSAATPYAAGVAALMLSANPTLSSDEISQRLKSSATDVVNVESGAGWDRYSGYGMINAAAAGYVLLPSEPAYGMIIGGDQTHADQVNYVFEGQRGDILINYEAYDLDVEGEVRILLNGAEVGLVPVTPNNDWSRMQTLLIPDYLITDDGDNYLTFDHVSNPPGRYWWGVRAVSVDEWQWSGGDQLPSELAYGMIIGGDQTHADHVNYTFEGQSGNFLLDYEVYDIDIEGEVRILLNGAEVGLAPVTGNNGWGGTQTLLLPDHLVKDTGDNYLTFDHVSNPPGTYWWGVRSVSLDEWPWGGGGYRLPSEPAYGTIIGGDQTHADHVNYVFNGQSGDILLKYEAFDIDVNGEVRVLLNGAEVGLAPLTANNDWGGVQTLWIPDHLVNDAGINYVTFDQVSNPPGSYWWGVRSVSVDEWQWGGGYRLPSEPAYGMIIGGDQTHVDEVNYIFEGRPGDILLKYEIYDIDVDGEVRILLNGAEIGLAPLTANSDWGGIQALWIPDHLANDTGDNYLTFDQVSNPPGSYWWGVRSVSVD